MNKIHLLHELTEDDIDETKFCEVFKEKLNQNVNFDHSLLFFGKSTFWLHESVNRHNSGYWSKQKPH